MSQLTPERVETENITKVPGDENVLEIDMAGGGLLGPAALEAVNTVGAGELPTNMEVEITRDDGGTGREAAYSPLDPDGSDDDVSFGGVVLDLLKAPVNGAVNAVGETLDFAEEVITGEDNDRFHNILGEQKTVAGKAVSEIAAFVTGFWTGGKLLKGMKLLQGTGKATIFARGTAQGALSDFFTADGQEENFSALIQKNSVLKNVVTETLATSKDSNEFEGRIKHAFEGMAFGAVAEPLAIVVGAFAKKYFRKGAVDALESGVEEAAPRTTSEDALEAVEKLEKLPPTIKNAFMENLDNDFLEDAGKNIYKDPPHATPFPSSLDNSFLMRNADDGTDPAMRGIPKRLTPNAEGYVPPTVMLHEEKGLDTLAQVMEVVNKHGGDRESALKALCDDVTLSDKILNDPDALGLLEKVHTAMYAKTLKARGSESIAELEKETLRMGERYGMPGMQDLFKKSVSGEIPLKDARHAARFIQMTSDFVAANIVRIARQYKLNGEDMLVRDLAKLDVLKTNLDNLYLAQNNIKTLTGRTLNSFKYLANMDSAGNVKIAEWATMPVGRSAEDIKAGLAVKGWTRKKADRFMADVLVNADDLGKVSKLASRFDTASKFGILNEFRINNMLSGPFTVGVNAIGNGLKTLLMPTERYLAGVITGNAAMRQEALDVFAGLTQFAGEAWRLGKKAGKMGDAVMDRGAGKLEANASAQMTYENVRKILLKGQERELNDVEEMLARSVGWFGPYARIPSRLLLGTDEFFKQLNFRASFSARLRRNARELGIWEADKIDAYIKKQMDQAFDPKAEGRLSAAAFSDDLAKASIQYARESTWTQDLGYNTVGGWVQQGVSQHPMLRLIVPFVKTPVNLFRDFLNHTPALNMVTRQGRDALAAGGEQAALLRARTAVGAMTMLTAGALAHAGFVTGSPPTDPKQRKALEATGWQPYSVRIGDSYVSYRRMDPVGMFFGIMADLKTAGSHIATAHFEEAGRAVAAALVNNITSKTYMQGISEFIDFMNDPTRTGSQFMGRFGSTFVPFSSAARFIRQRADDPMREARSILDYLMNTTPGFSHHLPARRNWVTGDVVVYDFVPRNKKDTVLDELNNIAEAVQGPPAKKLKGVELSEAQFSRLQELHGTVRIGGKTLYETLEELFNSADYDLHRNITADPPDKENGPRSLAVRRVIGEYRRAAQDALIDENSELEASIRLSDYQRAASRRGAMTTLNQQDLLDTLKEY